MKKSVLWVVLAAWATVPFLSYAQTDPKPKSVFYKLPGDTTRIEYVVVEGGTFTMGDSTVSDAKPLHQVTLNSFYIGKYEVTVKEYKVYLKVKGLPMPTIYPQWKDQSWHDNEPMVYVSWDDAAEFCKWAGGRLPTEAEWEYAARGGKYSKNYRYSGSNRPDEVAWHSDNSKDQRTQAVGKLKPNELGIYDMSGNIWEWCSDWYGRKYYQVSPKDNPQGPESSPMGKVRRGSSWFFPPTRSRIALRENYAPTTRVYGTGFRIVRDVPKE